MVAACAARVFQLLGTYNMGHLRGIHSTFSMIGARRWLRQMMLDCRQCKANVRVVVRQWNIMYVPGSKFKSNPEDNPRSDELGR
jgi:hypothetical protein